MTHMFKLARRMACHPRRLPVFGGWGRVERVLDGVNKIDEILLQSTSATTCNTHCSYKLHSYDIPLIYKAVDFLVVAHGAVLPSMGSGARGRSGERWLRQNLSTTGEGAHGRA
jgi:hypothetical protein